MSFLPATLSAFLLIGGAACLYQATPHQRLLVTPLSARTALVAGSVCLVGALAILLGLMGSATAVFTWTIGLMTAWTIPPVVIGWLRRRRETRP